MRPMVSLFLAACTGAGTDPITEPTPDPTDPVDTGQFDRSASLSGTVTDGQGDPVHGAVIRFCRGPACRNNDSDAAGAYTFDEVHVDWHSLEVKPPLGVEGVATAFAPVQFATDEVRIIDLVTPDLDPATPLPATDPMEIEAGAGLFVTVAADQLEAPLFVDDATEIAGVRLQPDQYPPVDLPGVVIAAWYLDPFDHAAADGLPVRFTHDGSLPDGATYRVMVGSYEDQRWLDAGTVTVSGPDLTGDARLPLTSTVVLLEE